MQVRFKAVRTGKMRTQQVSKRLERAVQAFCKGKRPGEYVFSTRQSSHMSERRVQQLLASYARQAGVRELTPRVIRYAAAKVLPTEEAKDFLGIKHVSIYTHGGDRA